MKRLFIFLTIACVMLSGCGHINWSTALSIGLDVAELRSERESAGKGHIEDVFVQDETTGEDR